MKKSRLLTIIAIGTIAGLSAACSTATNTTTNPTAANKVAANTATSANSGTANNNAAGGHSSSKSDEDAPAAVKAAFPNAQSFTKQHKDIPQSAVAEIEKETGGKVPDTDHHSYPAFSNAGGARRQIGAATVVTANGKELVVIYESRNGMPVIREVRGEGVPGAFLTQFSGKNHDDKLQVGADVKANGVDAATAKAIAQAIKVDAMTMQTLYGAEHSH